LSSLLTFIFAFFPINIYAAAQVSSITLQIFLVLSFFYFLLKLKKDKRTKNIVFFSFFSGLLILIRGEFFLFYFFTLTYFFFYYERKIKIILISLAVTLIVVSPYIYRNYLNFNTFVLTKSFGYNLLKGNNPTVKVEGNSKFIENRFDRKRLKIKTDNNYEINLDNLYRDEAINVLIKDPLKYLKFYFIKIFSFLLVDFNSSYPNYYNFFHLVPNFVLSLISLIGAIGALKKKGFFQFLSIFYFLNIFLFSIFFILPRYSVILLPIKLLLSIDVIKYLNRNYSKKFN
jgi:4-amino-4-deoxy-L-arabinose transferase-like glycosyltransferase